MALSTFAKLPSGMETAPATLDSLATQESVIPALYGNDPDGCGVGREDQDNPQNGTEKRSLRECSTADSAVLPSWRSPSREISHGSA